MINVATLNKISRTGLNELTDKYQIVDDLDQAAGIIVRSQDMKDMQFSDKLLCIARAGVGVNNSPTDRCAEEGIVVFNTPGANANAVKELVLAGLIMSSRNVIAASDWARALVPGELTVAKQVEKGKSQFKGSEIIGKTIGVIGLGGIGGSVANACADLGMKVIGYDAYLSVNNALHLAPQVRVVDSIAEMLPELDYLTVHVHANAETNGMINADVFEAIKPGATLLNYARASIVDEAALKTAIEKGQIAKYVTDFPNDESLAMPNTILTPHLGASTDDAEDNCAVMAVNELMDYIENGNIRNSVNFPVVSMGKCTSAARVQVLHKNIPNMIGQITGVLSDLNIANMTNQSKGTFACTMLDMDHEVSGQYVEKLSKINGVVRVRVL